MTTPRISLSPWSDADLEELHALFLNDDVARYLLDGERVAREWVEQEIEGSAERFRTLGAGLWAMRGGGDAERAMRGRGGAKRRSVHQSGVDPCDAPRISGARHRDPIGSSGIFGIVGFRHFFEPPELQLLYALHPSAHGRGLATEASRTVIRYAFETLAFDDVRAATDEPNKASIRVLERLGMKRWRVEGRAPAQTLFYRVERSSWVGGGSSGAESS